MDSASGRFDDHESSSNCYQRSFAKKTITQQDFRDAIMEYFDIPESSSVSSRYKGILLDGSDSTQMKVLNDYGNKVTIYNSKANRSLCSIVALRNKNI